MSAAPIDSGGPAFPHANPRHDGNWDIRAQIEGMSLRDWFATHAPTRDQFHVYAGVIQDDETTAQYYCRARYAYADAMIAARKGIAPAMTATL